MVSGIVKNTNKQGIDQYKKKKKKEVEDLWPKGKGVTSITIVKLGNNLDPFQGFSFPTNKQIGRKKKHSFKTPVHNRIKRLAGRGLYK